METLLLFSAHCIQLMNFEIDTFQLYAENSTGIKFRNERERLDFILKGIMLGQSFNSYSSTQILYNRLQLLIAYGFSTIWDRWNHIHFPSTTDIDRKLL
jgi:hypothetical protein